MREETLAVRIEPSLKKEVELIAKVLHISPSEWIRTRIAYEVRESVEDLKNQIVLEYLKGNLTRKELEQIFGGKLTEDIDFVIDKTRRDILKAKKLKVK